MRVPNHPFLRLILGILLLLGGIFSFLPFLGIWMLPLGLVVLSIDFPMIRRLRRRSTVIMGIWMLSRWPAIAKRIGFAALRRTRRSAAAAE
jgi:hypothetical protein